MTTTLSPDGASAPAPTAEQGPPPRGRNERIALAVLLIGTAALYLVNLSVNGWANTFYSGAVQAATRSWEAFFFGSSDAGGTVTVDKPPAALWAMALPARLFGLSSWTILVPQALMGVGTVALLHAAVRRVAGPAAGLIAGTVMALTPVAVLMFRFNNPDALLVLLMVAAAYAVVRAIEHAGTGWLVLAGVLMGFAFLTKTAQAFLVLPALALAYLWAAPTGPARRVRQLLASGAAMVVAGGWWFVVVDLWPSGTRPYIGGSIGDSAVQLALGYNGLGRLTGAEAGGGTGGGMGGGMGGGGFSPFGSAGPARLFMPDVAGQVSWLLPAALVLLVVGLVLTRRAPRTDRVRASLLVWGGWTVVTAVVFSAMQGIFHEYYTVALVPGIAAVVGIGAVQLWQHREARAARWGMAGLVLLTALAAAALLVLSGLPVVLTGIVLVAGLVGAAALTRPGLRAARVGLAAAVVAAALGPVAFAVDTVREPHTSAIPLAGPSTGGSPFGMPGGMPGMAGGMPPGMADMPGMAAITGSGTVDPALTEMLRAAGTDWSAATVSAPSAAELALASGTDVMGIGGFMGSDPAPTLARFQQEVAAGRIHYYIDGGGFGGGFDPAEMIEMLPPQVREDPQVAEMIERFENGEASPMPFGQGPGTEIGEWVKAHFPATTVGGRTVYDLTTPLP